MRARALWLPYEVDDLDAALRFYTVDLGLSRVDGWESGAERGAVLRAAGAAYLELVAPAGDPGPPPLAFELADASAVDGVYRTLPGADGPPRRYPRGHYGFTCAAPGGARVMVWSER